MYSVYSDTTMIHDGSSPDLDIHLIDPVLTIADSAAGTFNFTLPPNNVGYNEVTRINSTLFVKRHEEILWSGRVLSETKDFMNRRKIKAEGALAYLNDTNQPVATYRNVNVTAFLQTLIINHNAKVAANRQFVLGTVTVVDRDDDYVYQTNYKSTWETIKENLLDRLEGHIRIRYVDGSTTPTLDYLADYPKTATQTIDFGSNLLEFTSDWDLSNLATVIIPRGKQLTEEDENGQKDYVTVKTVNNNSIYVFNENAYQTYGRIERVVDFSDVEEPSLLLTLANAYVSNMQFDEMTLNVNAVDLHKMSRPIVLTCDDDSNQPLTDSNDQNVNGWIVGISDVEYDDFASFDLLDEVLCQSIPHGLNRTFPISQIKLPLDKPDGTVYTMGATVVGSMSANTTAYNSLTLKTIQNLPSVTNILGLAKQQATSLLTQRTTGYVTITEVDEHSEAIIISNTPNWQEATKLWMWNMNGLGYSNDGGETFGLAITMDGSIVADYVKTGILSDGYGLNWWNLGTGEFSLSYNTEFRNTLGDVLTIVDVNTLANTANTNAVNAGDAANTVDVKVETEKKKQQGSTNLLNGTNLLKSVGQTSDWALGTWASVGGPGGSKRIVDITDAPNKNIKVGVEINNTGDGTNNPALICQREVPLGVEQVYCLSCYAKGTGKLRIMAGKTVQNQAMNATATKDVSTEWQRYHIAIGTGKENTYSSSKYTAGIVNGKVDVYFGNAGGANTTLKICGMKLERGNSPSDWGESDFDTQVLANGYTDETAEKVKTAAVDYADAQADKLETFTREYVDTISDEDREFTKEQREALDESFTQAKVLKRLTNNYQAKGIYLENNQLYMNATYVRTGTLDAGIVKAGILTDRANVNKWNMVTGYLYTRNMEAINAKLSGKFECGGTYKMQVDNGAIHGYKGNTWVGSIDYTADMYNLDTQRSYEGLMLRAKGGMQIRMPMISVRSHNDNGIATQGFTGKKTFTMVDRIWGSISSTLHWSWIDHGIECINGLVVSVW